MESQVTFFFSPQNIFVWVIRHYPIYGITRDPKLIDLKRNEIFTVAAKLKMLAHTSFISVWRCNQSNQFSFVSSFFAQTSKNPDKIVFFHLLQCR